MGYASAVPPKARKNAPTDWSKWAVAARAATGLSQTEFGERVGVSKGSVTDWERAENGIDLRVVARILREFPGVVPPPPMVVPEVELRTRPDGKSAQAMQSAIGAGPARGHNLKPQTALLVSIMESETDETRNAILARVGELLAERLSNRPKADVESSVRLVPRDPPPH